MSLTEWQRVDESNGRTESPSADTLRVYFPVGATVSVAVLDHRRGRFGGSRTTILVTGALDGNVGNVSGLVCQVTGHGRRTDVGASTRAVIVNGYGNPEHAAGALVSDLARALYGSSTTLRLHVL